MTFLTHARRGDLFTHWVWPIPILLVVASLSIREINLYPPTPDEFYSMYNSGWLVGGPFTPLDVIESLYNQSPNHVPGYFILLSVWGNLTFYDIASARLLGIFCGLLSIAVCFRLARDFAGPLAGMFSIIIISSNSFYSYYIPHARMYSLMLLLAGVVLWLYFRIMFQLRPARRRDYIALGSAVFLFMSVHVFSGVFLLVLAVFQLAFVTRDRRWYQLALTVAAAVLLAAPYYLIVVARGIPLSQSDWAKEATSAWDVIAAWLELASNGQPLLVAISVAGLALAAKERLPRLDALVALVFIHLVVLGLLSETTRFTTTTNLRFLLPAFLIFLLLMAAGLRALYHYRRFLGISVMLWPVAGIFFQLGVDWELFLAGRVDSFLNPPWQVIARMASESEPNPLIIGYRISISSYWLDFPSRLNYSQRQHYFDRTGLSVYFSADAHDFNLTVRNNALVSPRIWVLSRSSITETEEIQEVDSAVANYNYELCGTIQAGVDAVILDYAWTVLDCAEPDSQLEARTALHEIHFFGANVSTNGSTLTFVDSWSATVDFAHEDYLMSFQLISADWDNVAQVDLPLVHEGILRQFSIDIGNVAPGNYRLMAIVYNKRTGSRLAWNDSGADPPELLPLADVVLE